MHWPLVSVIVAVKNGGRFLASALRSVVTQDYRPLEIIVVDGHSEDDTASIAQSFENVRYVQQVNRGIGDAYNTGIVAAQGDFIAFLDADDLWHSEKLARQVARLQERPEINLCFTHYQHFWAPELAEEAKRYQGHTVSQPLSAYLVSSLMVRRTVFETFGQFDNGLRGNENMIWYFRAAERGAIIEVLPDVLTYRRLHGKNLTKELLRRGEHLDAMFFPILKAWRDYQRRRQDG